MLEDMRERMPDLMPEESHDKVAMMQKLFKGCCDCASIATASLALFCCHS
jgi:hypothetical protein